MSYLQFMLWLWPESWIQESSVISVAAEFSNTHRFTNQSGIILEDGNKKPSHARSHAWMLRYDEKKHTSTLGSK